MESFYLVCTGVGGALVLCQFFASLLGIGGEHGLETDHEVHLEGHAGEHHDQTNAFLGLLTFRSISAAVAFFGLGGLSARYFEATPATTFLLAAVSGALALYLVAGLMKALAKLKADGTVRIERAVGQVGRVYLAIPGNKAGSGKVTLNLQNRTVECLAMTSASEIATGAAVTIVAVLAPNLVEVAPLPAA
jgi:hypothetical protein